jgi:5-methylcytosine-specific restriction endonuclease McrA
VTGEKKCTKCGQVKALTEFSKDRHKKDGLHPSCKDCDRKIWSKAKDKPKVAREAKKCGACGVFKSIKEFYKQRASIDCHTAFCKECSKDYVLAYRKEHPARPEQCKRWQRTYRLNHLKEAAENNRIWRQANLDKICANKSRRRVRESSALIELVSRATVYARDGGKCHVCGKKVNSKNWHLDHLIPLSKGGDHSYRNVATACPKCNLQRYNTGLAQLRLLD